MFNRLMPNCVLGMVAIVIIALSAGSVLMESGNAEYAAGVYGVALAALAGFIKALSDPDIPMVPASVVARVLDAGAALNDDGPRFVWRPNAMACLAGIVILTGVGAGMMIDADFPELAYAVIGLGIGSSATTLTDLIKPTDKEVPLPLAEKIADYVFAHGAQAQLPKPKAD